MLIPSTQLLPRFTLDRASLMKLRAYGEALIAAQALPHREASYYLIRIFLKQLSLLLKQHPADHSHRLKA